MHLSMVEGLLEAITDLMVTAPRSELWLPTIMAATEAVQLLVIHPANAEKIQIALKKLQSRQAAAEGSLDSQMITDLMHSINLALQGPQRVGVRVEPYVGADMSAFLVSKGKK